MKKALLVLLAVTMMTAFPPITNAQKAELVVQAGHAAKIRSVAFSSDGRYLASGSHDQTIKIWEVSTGEELSTLTGHKASVTQVAFSPDGKTLASAGSSDYSVRLWNVDTGKPLKVLSEKTDWKLTAAELENSSYDYYESVTTLAFSPDGETIASCNYKAIKFWDVKTGQLLKTIINHSNWIYSIVFVSEGTQIVSGGIDKVIKISDVRTGEVVKTLDDKTADEEVRYRSFSMSPDKETLLTVDTFNNKIKLWNIRSGLKTKEFSEAEDRVRCAMFLPDGFTIASADYEGTLRLRNLADGTQHLLKGHTDGIESIAYSSKKNILATASDDRSIVFWDVNKKEQLRQLGGWTSKISSGRFAHNEHILAIGFADSIIQLWDLKGGGSKTLDAKAESEPNPDNAFGDAFIQFQYGGLIEILFSPDDKYLVTGNRDIKLWETKTGRLVWTVPTKDVSVNTFAFSPNGKKLVSNSFPSGEIKMWDVDNGSKLREFPGHKLPIDSMTFSPDGILLASGSRDSNIKLWNVENGDEVATLTANAIPRWVLFNKEGDKLIAFNDNETIEVWDVLTHKRLALLDKKSPDTKPRLNELVSEVKIDDKALLDAKYQLKPDENGNTHLVDRFSKEVIGTLYRLNRDWVITTPTGRFDTNKPLNRVVNGLHWIISDQPLKPLPLDVFIRQYYEPSLLPRVLKCREEKSCDEEFKRLPPITELNRVQPKVAITEIKPAADGNDLLDITVDVENVTEDIEISAKDTTKKKRISSGVFDLRLFREGQLVGNSTPKQNLESFINDAPRFVEEDRIKKTLAPTSEDIAWRAANDLSNVTTFGKDGKAVYVFKNVKIPQNGKKEIKFSAYAFNSDRVKSNTAETVFKNETPKTRKGKTYLITIGVDASENPERHLYQSGKVALKFQEELGTRLMQSPENIVGVTLISKYKSDKNSELAENNATKLKIKALFSLLGGSDSADDRKILTGVANVEKMEPVQPEDELIILFSGHGDRDSNGFFYLLPYDIGSNPAAPNARRKLISSDELSLWLRDINAREIIFIIDSCKSAASVESGGFKPGPMGSRGLGQLAYDKGMKVLAAAQSFNSAWQQCALGQSILSYALLQNGLIEGKADTLLPKQRLTATEWLSYAEERVPELHLEVINGKYGTSCSQSQGPISDRLQTPKLFDFTTNESADPLIQLR